MRRRELIGTSLVAVAAGLAPHPGQAQGARLTVLGHAVHQRSLTQGKGGDIQAEWAGPAGVTVEWITMGVTEVHDRLFREASLARSEIGLGFVANRYVSPRMAELFEPLDPFLEKDGIEDFAEVAPGMREAVTFGGRLYGVPFRHATSGLHYNTEMLAERGLAGPPRTAEDMIEHARRLTYTRADGTQVHGLIFDGPRPTQIADLARAFGGDFLTQDYRCVADQPGMLKAVELLAEFYKAGVLPKVFTSFTTEDTITFMQQGRAAMAITPFGRYVNFNDPAKSAIAGKAEVVAVPASRDLPGAPPHAEAKTEFWVIAIPRNSAVKDLAWQFVKMASAKEATIRAALNGNGPVRPSAYADPRVEELVPYAAEEALALAGARPPLPGFADAARAEDIFIEELGLVLLGRKEPLPAMQAVVRRVEPLLARRG